MRWSAPTQRHGMVLLAVMIVITLAALIGATLLVTVDAERSGVQTTLRRTQSRALAWSGVQLAMAEFASRREAMIAVESFDIETEWELFEDEQGRVAVVRLIPISDDGRFYVSETAKVDLNNASKEMLAALPGIGTEERAQNIIDARPFASVEELVRVDGFAADLIYGFSDTPDALAGVDDDASDADRDVGSAGSSSFGADGFGVEGTDSSPALIDLLTVFSFDPNVQAGLADPSQAGRLRLNLNVPWSDRLARAIEEQWGTEAAQGAERIFSTGMSFTTDRQVIENLMQLGLNTAERMAPIADAVTASNDMYRLGRIDVNLASAQVLASLPGLSMENALELVDVRERLASEDRLSPLWMVAEGGVSIESYALVADYVTTRSTQWRIRIEAGYRSTDSIAPVAGVADSVMEGLARDLSMSNELEDKVIYDVVIDAASKRPRVAYMREVTLLELARTLRRQDIEQRGGRERSAYEADLAAELGLDEFGAGFDASLDDEEASLESAGTGPSWRNGSRLDEQREVRRNARTARRNATRSSSLSPDPDIENSPEPAMPDDPVDRRIGRWRSGGGT